VVAQVQRLGDPAEAVRVVGHAGDRQQLVDAAGGEDEPVEREVAGPSLGIDPLDALRRYVHPGHRAQDQPRAGQPIRERDADAPRLEVAAAHLGQQRQVEEVVGRVDQDDLGVGRVLRQATRRVVPGEARADDDDAGAHAPTVSHMPVARPDRASG